MASRSSEVNFTKNYTLLFFTFYSDTTQLDVKLSTRSQREQLSPSMNVVTQLTQFVGRDVINKTRLTWLYAVQLGQLSCVELCRYKHPFRTVRAIVHRYEKKSSIRY